MKRIFAATAALAAAACVNGAAALAGSYAAPQTDLMQKYEYRHEDCNQYCLYQKANETIGIQAIYLLQKLDYLKTARRTMDETRFREQLPGFCLSGESKETCWKRYLDLQVVHLHKMRSALIQNGEAAARLSTEIDKDGKRKKGGAAGYYRPANDGKAKGDPNYVITFEDLQKHSKKLQFLSGNDYQRWASSLPREPSKEDFILMKEIPRDPSNPNAGTFLIVDRDSGGNFKYDKKRYEEALQHYREEMSQHYRRMGTDMAMPADSAPKDFKGALGANDREYFREARAQYVSSISSLAKKGGIQSTSQVTFSGKPEDGRGPASGGSDTSGITENQQPVRGQVTKNATHFRFGEFSPDQILKAIDMLRQ